MKTEFQQGKVLGRKALHVRVADDSPGGSTYSGFAYESGGLGKNEPMVYRPDLRLAHVLGVNAYEHDWATMDEARDSIAQALG